MMHIDEVLIRERNSWEREGRKKGLAEGRKSGLAEGRKSGLAEGRKSGLLEGRTEGRLKIIRKMLKSKVKDDLIKEYTEVNEKELEKIKEEMQSQAV